LLLLLLLLQLLLFLKGHEVMQLIKQYALIELKHVIHEMQCKSY